MQMHIPANTLDDASIIADVQEQVNQLYEDFKSLGELLEDPTAADQREWITRVRSDITQAIRQLTSK